MLHYRLPVHLRQEEGQRDVDVEEAVDEVPEGGGVLAEQVLVAGNILCVCERAFVCVIVCAIEGEVLLLCTDTPR